MRHGSKNEFVSIARMRSEFTRIMCTPGQVSTADANLMFDQIKERYCNPKLHYHNVGHILHLWEQADDLQWGFENPDAVIVAILLHDAVFHLDKRDVSNEELSARLAEDLLKQAGYDAEFVSRVADLIRMTEKHETFEDDDHDAKLFLDMDMVSFGLPHDEFLHNSINVAKEMVQSVGANQCKKNMLGFMGSLKDKKPFFLSELYEEKYGEQARKNIAWEIDNIDIVIASTQIPGQSGVWSAPSRHKN